MNREVVKKEVIDWVKSIAFAILLGLAITTFVAQPTKVFSVSMQPTMYEGNRIVLEKVTQKFDGLSRGDIVAFKSPTEERNLIKRIIALGGDKLEIKDGKVFINGKELHEPYIKGGVTPGDISITVPEHKLFMMGDNRSNSYDSRYFGCIDKKDIIGKALFQYYPLNEIGPLKQQDPTS